MTTETETETGWELPEIQSTFSIRAYGDFGSYSFAVDRAAVDKTGTLYYISVVGHSSSIKGFGAFLRSNRKGNMQTNDYPYFTNGYRTPTSNTFSKKEGGYQRYSEKLEYGLWHAAFVTLCDGFMPNISDQSLWLELNKSRFTTPILKAWIPYIREALGQQNLLRRCYGFQANCGMLLATTTNLDYIVKEGLEAGIITIPARVA